MPLTVQARLDLAAEDDLALLRSEGRNDSEVIRVALREAAERADAGPRCASRPRPLPPIPRTSRRRTGFARRWTRSRRPGPRPEAMVRGEVFRLRAPRMTRDSVGL